MKFEIPAALRAEHEELHAQLVKATKEPGGVGEAAREVARLLHPHFVREEEFALPPLGLLSELARGPVRPEMAAARPEYERFVRALLQHAETEERVLYPAVILLGEHLERTLKKEPVTPNVA